MSNIVTRPGPAFVVPDDFNRDGHLDLAIANLDNSSTSILLGDGQGNFNESVYINGDSALPNTIVLGDVDNDNITDVLVVNNGMKNVDVFLGEGDGNFFIQAPVPIGENTSPFGLALGDIDKDGILDLVVTDSQNYNVLIFSGAGDGTFSQTLTLNTADLSRPYSVVIVDLNKDSNLDVLVSNIGTGDISVFLNDGTGNFGAESTYATDAAPYRLITADFNRDGNIDAATSNLFGNSISILLGNGDGTFAAQRSIFMGNNSAPFGIMSGHFNNDTILDLVVANSQLDNISILTGYGDGNFNQTLTYSTGNDSNPDDVTVGDFNEDGLLDIVSANYLTGSIGIFYNRCV